jgi:cephalosporin-C deacetylase
MVAADAVVQDRSDAAGRGMMKAPHLILNPGVVAPDFRHDIPFDPTYGYALADLLKVAVPGEVEGFETFWTDLYRKALSVQVDPRRVCEESGSVRRRVWDIRYRSVGDVEIGGWLMMPREGRIRRGIVVGHGYGGRDMPHLDFPLAHDSAILFPCVRGLSKSQLAGVPSACAGHVLCGIDSAETYVLGGCVADVWCGVTALQELVPEVGANLFYSGESLGGGLGALALPWDRRFLAGHLVVPTFGNHPLRLQLKSCGSGEFVRQYVATHPDVVADVLPFFDAAVAAARIHIPMLSVCALFDPAVPPPGQFSIHNALSGPKQLYVLQAGHYEYPGSAVDLRRSQDCLVPFFDRHTPPIA